MGGDASKPMSLQREDSTNFGQCRRESRVESAEFDFRSSPCLNSGYLDSLGESATSGLSIHSDSSRSQSRRATWSGSPSHHGGWIDRNNVGGGASRGASTLSGWIEPLAEGIENGAEPAEEPSLSSTPINGDFRPQGFLANDSNRSIYPEEPLRRTVYPRKLSINSRDERNNISHRSIQIPGSHKSGGHRRQGAAGFDTCGHGSRNSAGSSGKNRFSGNLFDAGNRRLAKVRN